VQAPVAVLFANLKGNLGDFAILQAMLEDLSRRFPESPLQVVPHPLTDIDHTNLESFRRNAPAFEIVGPPYRFKYPFFLKWMTHTGYWSAVQSAQVHSLSRRWAKDAEKFSGHKAIVVAGGDQWGGVNLATTMIATVRAISISNRNIHGYPFSLSPDVERLNSAKSFRLTFASMSPSLIARDKMTHRMLSSFGVSASLGVDCVFSLQDLAEGIAPAEGRRSDRVIFMVTGKDCQQETIGSISALLSEGIPVELVSTSPPEDVASFRSIGRALDIPVHMPGTWQDAVAELKASSLVVTNRLHAIVFSSFGDAAVLPVADRAKAAALATDMGITQTVPDVASATPRIVRATLANRASISGAMHQYRRGSRTEIWSPFHPVP
jgi:Uncharacterized conserved protein